MNGKRQRFYAGCHRGVDLDAGSSADLLVAVDMRANPPDWIRDDSGVGNRFRCRP